MGRFHRGLSLSLVLLTGLILVVEALRHHPAELLLLGVLLAAIMAMGRHMLVALCQFRELPPPVTVARRLRRYSCSGADFSGG